MPSVVKYAPVLSLALTIFLTVGCSSPESTPSDEEPLTGSIEPTSEPEAPRPEFVPGGSAEANLPVFELTLQELGAGMPGSDISLMIEGLVAVGFERESMSHTAPASKIELPADSTSIAVEMAGECVIGQFSDEWLTVAVAAPTPSGCLIGDVVNLTSLEESP